MSTYALPLLSSELRTCDADHEIVNEDTRSDGCQLQPAARCKSNGFPAMHPVFAIPVPDEGLARWNLSRYLGEDVLLHLFWKPEL